MVFLRMQNSHFEPTGPEPIFDSRNLDDKSTTKLEEFSCEYVDMIRGMKLQRDKSNGQLAAEKERSSRQEGTVLTRVCRSDSGVKAH